MLRGPYGADLNDSTQSIGKAVPFSPEGSLLALSKAYNDINSGEQLGHVARANVDSEGWISLC